MLYIVTRKFMDSGAVRQLGSRPDLERAKLWLAGHLFTRASQLRNEAEVIVCLNAAQQVLGWQGTGTISADRCLFTISVRPE